MAKDLSAAGLIKSDPLLKDVNPKWNKIASDSQVEATRKALDEKKHKVTVVSDAKSALKVLDGLLPKGASLGVGHSSTLEEIGFIDLLKNERKDLKNYQGEAAAAEGKGDYAAAGEARARGFVSDVFFSSAAAVSETGEFTACDLTGTRIAGWLAAKSVVIVVGANKIVPTFDDLQKRMWEWQVPFESARARVAYGVAGSYPNNQVTIRGANPFGPGRFHIIIVKGTALGF